MKPGRVRIPRGSRAFTLIEVLMAAGIFGMVMVAVYASWSAILRGARLGLTAAAEVQRTRVTMRALQDSLGAAIMYSDNARYYSFVADTSGNFAGISFVARLPNSFPGSGLYGGQNLRRVTFEVDGDKNLNLLQAPILQTSEMATPYKIRLAPNVAVFAMEFFDARRGEWVPEWLQTNTMPRMVRVGVSLGRTKAGSQAPEVTTRLISLTAVGITRIGGVGGQPGNVGQPGAP